MISGQEKKKAIYISSSDIEARSETNDLRTVTDLYRLSYVEAVEDDEQLLDPANLEVNISCGNIIVIIDGLDEIEAKLKDRFNFDEFIQNAVSLNEYYNSCTIIVTSRDYYRVKYDKNENIELLSLPGFDDELVEKYFSERLKRLSRNSVAIAMKQLRALNISQKRHYPPVILSLVCDILESEEKAGNKPYSDDLDESKYLLVKNSFDALVVKLIDREIKRQSLKMDIDDVVDVLFLIASYKGKILKTELNKYLNIYENDEVDSNYSSFYANALFRSSHDNEYVSFQYDNLLLVLRSRYFNHRVGQNFKNSDFIRSILLEFYDGTGELLMDIVANNSYSEDVLLDATTSLIKQLISEREENILAPDRQELDKNKKCISAILYYFFKCFPILTKKERSEHLNKIYSGDIRYVFIFGEFYPLDFRELKIKYSGFYEYENFEKSDFPQNKKVFFNSEFERIDPKANLNVAMGVFDETCRVNDRLKLAIVKGEGSKYDLLQAIKNDFILLFSVLYRNRMFVKKSENLFRNNKSKIYPKLALEDYLTFYIDNEVFDKVKLYGTSSKYHYSVSDKYKDDVRYLLTNNNFRQELEVVFKAFLHKHFKGEY